MCRFMMISSPVPADKSPILEEFARKSQNSRPYDGDWQGDGWGISWLSGTNNGDSRNWQSYSSLRPIWEESGRFDQFPPSEIYLVHARSASFPEHKGVSAYNQPFVNRPFSFVFNGLVRGMRSPKPLPGDIGSQKIWGLLQEYLEIMDPPEALRTLQEIVIRSAREVQALNIGLSDGKNLFGLCLYSRYPEYYSLHVCRRPGLEIISSEPLDGYDFEPVSSGEIINIQTR